MLLEKQCRIISRRTQRLTERFTAVAHKLLSRFGLQSKKKCFSFNRVTSFERERERKLKEKAFKAISGWPRATKAQCVKSLKVKGSLWTKRLNQLFFFVKLLRVKFVYIKDQLAHLSLHLRSV